MADNDDEELIDNVDEREQIAASIVAGVYTKDDLSTFVGKAPYADAEGLFTELLQLAVDRISKLGEEERAEVIGDLLAELNWNYIFNEVLNEASEAGLYTDGETKLLEDEENS